MVNHTGWGVDKVVNKKFNMNLIIYKINFIDW